MSIEHLEVELGEGESPPQMLRVTPFYGHKLWPSRTYEFVELSSTRRTAIYRRTR